MTPKNFFVASALVVAVGLGLAYAQIAAAQGQSSPPGKGRNPIGAADTNNDGAVTLEELQAVNPKVTEESFARMDTNGDGVLTAEDRQNRRGRAAGKDGRKPGAGFAEADTDGNGVLSASEFSAAFPGAPVDAFSRIDADSSGTITQQELKQAHETREAVHGKLREADTNGDRQITRAEFDAAIPNAEAGLFDRLDRNGDGVLNRDDRPEGGPGPGPGRGPGRGNGNGPGGQGMGPKGNRQCPVQQTPGI